MSCCLCLIWKRSNIRWTFTKRRTGVSYATTQFRPSSILTKIINIKDGAERFEQAQKEREASPTKRSRRDRNTPKETFAHKSQDQETLETRSLGAILSTAFFLGKQRQRNLRSMHLVYQKSRFRHNILQMTIEQGSQVTGAFVQLRIVEHTRRGTRHGSSPEQKYWALMRDHYRR